MQKRRYEILLPLKFNDGNPVPFDTIDQTRDDLVAKFRGATLEPSVVQGRWRSNGEHFADELMRVVVDVNDTEDNRRFFEQFKLILRERFQQIEIYIVSYPIDII